MQHIGAHGGKVMYIGSFCFKGDLGFRNSDAICIYVVNKQFGQIILWVSLVCL